MGSDHGSEIIYRRLDTHTDTPAVDVATIVAELEGKDTEELTSIWNCIDDVLDEIFSNPPAPEAQVEVNFSYEGYRVSVDQNGIARFIHIS